MTNAGVTAHIQHLSDEQRARLLQSAWGEVMMASGSGIPRREPSDDPPLLALAQQRLWLHDQIRPGSRAYNEVIALRLEGPLDEATLRASLDEIVRRHEPLRTEFPAHDGVPVQAIVPPEPVPVAVVDLRDRSQSDQNLALTDLARAAERHPFDLACAPLLRVSLIRLAEALHVLLIAAHHIIVDGWSVGVLRHELSALYDAFRAGRPSPLPGLAVSFADFAVWQRRRARRDVLDQQLSYWRARLANPPPVLQLPMARPRPALEGDRGARRFFSLGAPLRERLLAFSRAEGVTLFMTLCAAFQVLLYRLSGQTDIAVGTAVAYRSHPDGHNLIGCFVNTVVLRGDLSGCPSAREAVRRIARTALDAFDRAEVPFEAVVEALRVDRSPSHNPLFQVFFVLQNTPRPVATGVSLAVTVLPLDSGTSKFDMIVSMEEDPDGFTGYIQYNTDLFDADAIDQIIASFETLLEGIVAAPEQSIDLLSVVPPADLHRILVEWNCTKAPVAEDRLVHELIRAQAALTPQVPAVTDGEKTLTYAALDRHAGALAWHLHSRNIGPGRLVGVFIDRCCDGIVAILGVLRAGAGYVPLDPCYPAERITAMAADAKLAAVVTVPGLRDGANRLSSETVVLDADREAIRAGQENAPLAASGPDDIGYVIYTSGSTGTPKGVVVTHRNIIHSTAARWSVYEDPVSAFLLLSSISFDSSVAGIFWTLTQGGTLVIPPQDALADIGRLCQMAADHRVTHLLAIPSLFALILEEAGRHRIASLRTAIVAGAACPARLVETHYATYPGVLLFNEYGPTEATVWSTVHRCEVGTATPVAIGRPIPNARIYLLDRHGQPVPLGVPGEICIGGAGVARGYLNRPDLTAERFVADLYSDESGARLYRTGDLARYLPDGCVELLGRTDRQVKVRGFRVEPEAIEAALQALPGIREAVVDARPGSDGEPRLVAWVVPDSEQIDVETVSSALVACLPAHEVPTDIELRPTLPRLANGKVDRARLLARNATPEPLPSEPWTEFQEGFAGICRDILQRDVIGLDDNFFELGADSLSIIRIFNKLRTRSDAPLTVTDLFRYPTIRGLSQELEGRPVTGVL